MAKFNSTRSFSGFVEKYVGSAYDTVKKVADKLTEVVSVGNNITKVAKVADSLDSLILNVNGSPSLPTTTDDSSKGFSSGSNWVYDGSTPARIFRCTSAQIGNAVWVEISSHTSLSDTSLNNSHPINAITNLQTALDSKEDADISILKSAHVGSTVQGYSPILASSTASFTVPYKDKLDGISIQANNYLHPLSTYSAVPDLVDGDVLSNISIDSTGHLTGLTTRTLNFTDVGAEGALGYTAENTANKGSLNGYAPLVSGKVPTTYLPSYVDSIAEYANLASFPVSGLTNTIYLALGTSQSYRWSGSQYVSVLGNNVVSVAGKSGVVVLNTDDLSEGANLFYTDTRVASNASVVANTAKVTNANHTGDVVGSTTLTISDKAVTLPKIQDIATQSLLGRSTVGVGVPEVLTASDVRIILNVADGATSDQTASNVPSNVGTSLVGNTVQEDLDTLDAFVATTNQSITTLNNNTSNINNTSDLNKPVSTATQNALNTKLGVNPDGGFTTSGGASSFGANGVQGGSIELLKGTGSTLTGTGAILDQIEGKIRFYDQGGNNKGVYLDVPAQADNASSKLLTDADTGTSANKLVQLDTNAKLPAIDGSQLINLAGSTTDISFISKSGHNNLLFLIDGVPYSASGNSVGNSNTTTGRGLDNTIFNYSPAMMSRIPIPSISPVAKLGGGYSLFAYALLENGELYTWGHNNTGQCGLGHTTPVGFPTLASTGVTDVYDHPTNGEYSVTNNKLIIRKTDGYLYGTGYNLNGSLGDGTTTNRSSFVQLTGFGNSILNAWNLGAHTGCIIVQRTDHTIWVAGYGVRGALGNEGNTNVPTPIEVTSAWGGGTGWVLKQVSFSGSTLTTVETIANTIAMLLDNGTTTKLSLCGDGAYGQLGNGSTSQINVPVVISPESTRIKEIAFSRGLVMQCLYENGNLYAWGYNGHGGVGNGTITNVLTPVLVNTDVVKLFSDGMTSHTYGHRVQQFIKKTDGHVYSAGYNDASIYLGLGSQSPITVTTFEKVKLPEDFNCTDIGHMCTATHARVFVAINAKGDMYVWGYNVNYGVRATNANNTYIPEKVNYS